MRRMTAQCVRCKTEYPTRIMTPVFCANRGKGKPIYICERCATTNESYGTDNNREVGKVFDGFRYGLELETNVTSLEARAMLYRYSFIATDDCSLNNYSEDDYENATQYVDDWGDEHSSTEYVSGINNGLKRFVKEFSEIEKYYNREEIISDTSCGSHTHISYYNMGNGEMFVLQENPELYRALFSPMQDLMVREDEKTKRFFGRFFSDSYARMITSYIATTNRYLFINVTNSNNIEFRINKFRTSKQFIELIKFEKWVVKCLENNFFDKFKEDDMEWNMSIAIKTGKKIEKKLKEYYDNLDEIIG